jgi:hypothetical protein
VQDFRSSLPRYEARWSRVPCAHLLVQDRGRCRVIRQASVRDFCGKGLNYYVPFLADPRAEITGGKICTLICWDAQITPSEE